MFDNQEGEDEEYEKSFQRMLVNNMQETIKIFFRGCKTTRVKQKYLKKKYGLEPCLSILEYHGIIKSRIRQDTKIKQYHAGSLFEYLQTNIKLG